MFTFLASSWFVDFSFMGLALVYDLKDPPLWGELGHKRSQRGCGGCYCTLQPNVVKKKYQKNFSSQMSNMWNHTLCYKKTVVTMITDLPNLSHLAGDTRISVFTPAHPPHDENLPHYPNYDESLIHSLACLWLFWFETPSHSLCKNKLYWLIRQTGVVMGRARKASSSCYCCNLLAVNVLFLIDETI